MVSMARGFNERQGIIPGLYLENYVVVPAGSGTAVSRVTTAPG